MSFNPVRIEKHLRGLCRLRVIRPHDLAAGLALLWSCRAPGAEEAMVSLRRLADLAGIGRRKAVQAVQRLAALGVLSWRRTRVRVSWGRAEASRQGPSVYRWRPDTECTPGPAYQTQESKQEGIEAERALAAVRVRREWVVFTAWRASSRVWVTPGGG